MANAGWIKNSADGATAELFVYDEIGFWGTTANSFRRELQAIGNKPITVRINSMGGEVADAVAIYNILAERGNVTTHIDGLAASAASIIAMAGKTRSMAENGWLMIHNPSVQAWGSAEDLKKAINALDAVREGLVNTYTRRTGNDAEKVSKWMDEETWFTATQAKENNFIDSISAPLSFSAHLDPTRFRKAPEAVQESYRGRNNQPINDDHIMSAITDFLNRASGKPSEREAFLAKSIENLGLKPDELFEAKDEQVAKKMFDAAVVAAGREASEKLNAAVADHAGRIVSVEAALKAAGFELKVEDIGTLAEKVNARIKEQASREAATLAASLGIKPQPTDKAAAAGTTSETSNLKGREKVIAAFEAEFKGKSTKSN